MKKIALVIAFIFLFGCSRAGMKFNYAPGTNQNDFQTALKDCGEEKQEGYFLFGPLIILAPVMGAIEGTRYYKKKGVQTCMEGKGYRCVENCPNGETPPKAIDPQVLTKWTEIIKTEKQKEWIHYGNSPNGLTFYYNPASVSILENRYVFFRDQIKLPDDSKENKSLIWRSVKVNCADKIFKLSDIVAADKNGNATDSNLSETHWQNLPETSIIGIFAYRKCPEKGITSAGKGGPEVLSSKEKKE